MVHTVSDDLYSAIRFRQPIEKIQTYISEGADVNVSGHCGTALTTEASTVEPRLEVLKLLLDAGATVDLADINGETAFHKIAQMGSKEAFNFILPYMKDADIRDICQRTPLMRAAQGGHREIVQALLEHGANINAQQAGGDTPLVFAVEFGQTEIVQLLLKNGADITLKNRKGLTPYQIALKLFEESKSRPHGMETYKNIANILYNRYVELWTPLYEQFKQLSLDEAHRQVKAHLKIDFELKEIQ